jgi:hypothetical protein
MSKYTLNIGLANPVMGKDNSIDSTLIVALDFIRDVENVSVQQSASERTVVIDFNFIWGSLNVLSAVLDQDCIALLDNETGKGELFGDKAEAWAPFNPEFFLTNDKEVA